MGNETVEQFKAQMGEWQTKLDELRVQGNLLKMELRDQKDDVCANLDSAYTTAKTKLGEWANATGDEAERLGAGRS